MRGSLSRLALTIITCVLAWAGLMYFMAERGDGRDGSHRVPASAGASAAGALNGPAVNSASGDAVRVVVLLRDQTALSAVQRSRYASLLAEGAPAAGGKRVAAWERARGDAMRSINAQVGDGAKLPQLRVIERLKQLGARVRSHSLAPSAIVVDIPRSKLPAARAIDGVQSVQPITQGKPLAASAGDGSPTWHTAGCLGSGALDIVCPAAAGATNTPATPGAPGGTDSADGNGGPDVAVIDTGVNLFHSAWGARSPRVITPSGRATTSGAPGPCPSAPAAGGFWCGYGTQHGNAAAAIIASRDSAHIGMAPGVDKLLDPLGADSVNDWLSGFTSDGEAPASDLPEVINNSLGAASTTDDGYGERVADMFVSTLGIARSGAAGNDGPGVLGVAGQLRVASPCIAYNTLCMGAVDAGASGRADDSPATYSSVGPTTNGRKKPDLLAQGTAECPSTVDDGAWVANCGTGTSYSAARGAAALALLAGAGVTNTAAQRALLINSAYMVPSAQDFFDSPVNAPARYWTTDAGWGELALEQTFDHRGDFALGSVTAAAGAAGAPGPNSARFYRIDGMQAGERVTLAWNRGIQSPNWPGIAGFAPRVLTDLDLFLYRTDGADNDDDLACTATGASVSNCGVDKNEKSEQLGALHVPGDARDNVEQVRGIAAGTSIVKVKAASGIDGAAAEQFALAGERGVKPLTTPSLNISEPVLSSAFAHDGEPVTVTATITNESSGSDLLDGLTLQSVSASISAPGVDDVVPVDDAPTTLAPGETDVLQWTLTTSGDALHQISINANGSRFGEDFGGSSRQVTLAIDNDAPRVVLDSPTSWIQSRTAALKWRASDTLTGAQHVQVQTSVDGGPYTTVYSGADAVGAVDVSADEGQSVQARIRATDAAGNVSDYVQPSGWSVDAEPPTILIQAPAVVPYGAPATVIVRAHNVGAPVQAYVRTGASKPFEPLQGDSFTIPAIARLGLPVKVEAQALDSLNRVARASATIKTRASKSSLALKGVKRGEKTLIQATLAKKSSGTLAVAATCAGKRLQSRTVVRGKRTALVSLRGGSGLCTVRATFYPTESYRSAAARASKRIRF